MEWRTWAGENMLMNFNMTVGSYLIVDTFRDDSFAVRTANLDDFHTRYV
jgi:hypothetical protein